MCWKFPADVRLVRLYHAENEGVDYWSRIEKIFVGSSLALLYVLHSVDRLIKFHCWDDILDNLRSLSIVLKSWNCTSLPEVSRGYNNPDSQPEFGICVLGVVQLGGEECAVLCCQLYSHQSGLSLLSYSISTSTPPLSSTKYSWSLGGLPKFTSAP